jgi:ABC-type polar amino acid transport system ATPase subunit
VLLEVVGLRKLLAGRPVLNGLTFDVSRASSTVIMGPSGCGKTTLLRCLNGLEHPDEGTIAVGNCRIRADAPTAQRELRQLRQKVGMVFQHWNLFAHRTVLQNVTEAPIHAARRSSAEANAQARRLLERVGIAHRADAYPDRLSGGEQQRTAIARALAMEPDVLLLDEPTSALDNRRVDDVLGLLNDLRASGLTLISVTHDDRVCRSLGERVLRMEEGRFLDEEVA